MKNQIKVLHIIHTLEIGGAEKLLLSTVAEMKKKMNVKICSMYGNDELYDSFKSLNIEIFRLNFRSKFNPLIIWKIYQLIKLTRPDLIHTHLFFATFYGMITANLCRVPVIVTEHNESNWQSKNILLKIANRFNARNCTRMIAVSNKVKSTLIERSKVHSSKITVINNCISIQNFNHKKGESRSYPDNELIIGTVARFDFRKGIDVLLNAIAYIKPQVNEVKCILVGDGKEKAHLRQLVKELNIEKNVEFAGMQEDILPFLKKMHMFVLPSRTEGFGIAILEAMAAGCPIIASNVGGIPEIIENEVNGLLVQPDDNIALANAILRLNNRDFAKRISQNAYDLVQKKFSGKSYISKLKREYSKALNRNGC